MEHLLSILHERDIRHDQRFVAQEKAVIAALIAAKEAVDKAELASQRRFEAVNEFRAQLSDQATTFMPRLESEQRIAQNTEKIEQLNKYVTLEFARSNSRLDVNAGRGSGLKDGWGYIVGFIGAFSAAIAIVITLTH